MKTFLYAAFVAGISATLSSCASDGSLDPAAQNAINNVVKVSCQLDPLVNSAITTSTAITAIADPAAAPELALANQADQLAHPAVVAACAAAAPGSIPTAVTVTSK